MELTEEKRGIWLNFPECTPEDGEQVVVKRNGWYEILVYNEYHQCWDDSEGDDYFCDLEEVKDNDLYLIFQIGESNFKAKWQAGDNYAVWQTCGYIGDDYSGYMLFPTHTKDEYFCVNYHC